MKTITALACTFALGLGYLSPALSEPRAGSAEIFQTRGFATFAELTLDQAVSMVERQFKARVVRADTQKNGDRTIYVLRLLNSAGRVWTVRVDAHSGQVE